MRILITGATGHIGSALLTTALQRSPTVDLTLVDDLSAQRYCTLFDLPGGPVTFVERDYRDPLVLRSVAEHDLVIHLAALTDAASSNAREDAVMAVNHDGTLALADACAHADVPMLFFSTTSVYGSQASVVDETCPDEELVPQSAYARSKRRAEVSLAAMAETQGLRHTTLRLGTIVGPSTGMRFHTAVNKFCWQASIGQPITVWKTALHQTRPYLAIDDACAAILHFARMQRPDGRIYNIVTSNRTVHDIVVDIRTHRPDLEIRLVDSEIMNQLSYEVRADRAKAAGFVPHGSITDQIAATMKRLGALRGRPAPVVIGHEH